jgi:flagellar hook-associated protein 2
MPIKECRFKEYEVFMPAMSVGGLASGLDTNSIIAQLTALEQMKVQREAQKKENAQKTLDTFKDLQTRLGNLASKANALETQSKFNVFKATSNYEDYVSVSGKEGATAGQYEIVVKQLATTQKVYSNKIDTINAPLVAPADQGNIFGSNDTVSIFLSKTEDALKKDPFKKDVEIKISKNDTLKDIVNKINAAEGAGVKASIMTMSDGDNRLVLTAVETGTKGFQITDDSTSSGNDSILEYLGILSSGGDQIAASKNALLALNGEAVNESNQNTITFDQLNTVMNKNNLASGDQIGIYLPTDNGSGSGGWVVFNLHDGTNYRTIESVLTEINGTLSSAGANFTAKLNSSGEIVLKGDLANDPNFNESDLKDVKIQIGTPNGNPTSSANIFSEVKKDMGTFTSRSTFTNVINDGQNAIYTIDGMTVSSQSNSDDKTIDGTVFTLKKVSLPGMEPVRVSLDLDKDAIVNNITAFVDEFNALMKFIDDNMKATVKEEKDPDTGRKTNKREVGPFTGDSNISGLRDKLKRMMTGIIDELAGTKDNGYSTLYSSASRIGITTQKDGSLGIDKDKLTKAINADFEGVRRLFTSNSFSDTVGFSVGNFTKNSTTGVYKIAADGEVTLNGEPIKTVDIFENKIITLENGVSIEIPNYPPGQVAQVTFVRGIANQIANFMEMAKSSVDGYFKASEKTYQNRIDNIQKRVDELQIRTDNYNARIAKQFAALERSMSNLQSQTANMMSALSGISYKR